MKALLLYLDARLGEPATWVAIGGLLTTAHIAVSPGTMNQVTLWGSVLSFALGVVLKEAGTKSAEQIAVDAVSAAVAAIKAAPAPPAA